MFDIDDLIEPRRKGQKPRTPFALTREEVSNNMGSTEPYDMLGQDYPEGMNLGKDYQRIHKNRRTRIESIKPDDYFNDLKQSADQFMAEDTHGNSRQRIDAMKQSILRGEKLPLPYLEYSEGKYADQEGRHRMIAAKELGYEKVPVAIIDERKEYGQGKYWSQYTNKLKPKQNPFTYEKEEIWDADYE